MVLKRAAAMMLACLAAGTGVAQVDPGIIAQGQVLGGMAQGYADRGYAEGRGRNERRRPAAKTRLTRAEVSRICINARAGRSGARWDDPRLRRLLATCRRGGL
jgi:hypothetical protein